MTFIPTRKNVQKLLINEFSCFGSRKTKLTLFIKTNDSGLKFQYFFKHKCIITQKVILYPSLDVACYINRAF